MLKGSTTAYKIPKSMCCTYDTDFKLMIIQHAQETNNCASAWEFHVTEQHL
jgi:hypothetical protein